MADFDREAVRLTIKIVYYGPGMSGKTTNVMRLHDMLAPGRTGELMLLDTQGDRTLFFDLLPLFFKVASGLTVNIKLFTVPGQVQHNATRKSVLSRADAVAFIADSQKDQTMNNAMSFENLEENTRCVGIDFERLPLVIQFNKRDLPSVVSEPEIRRRWGPTGLPVVLATAIKSEGVLETFSELLRRSYRALNSRYALQDTYALSEQLFLSALVPLAGKHARG